MSEYGDMLRAARKRIGLRIVDVAERLDVSVPYLSDVERGKRDPLASEKESAAAELLDLDAVELLECRSLATNNIPIDGLSREQLHSVVKLVARMRREKPCGCDKTVACSCIPF